MMKRKLLKAMLLCFFVVMAHNLFAQNIVTGSVKDDTGQFLPGVSVVIKGTTNGTVTDTDGKFSLSAPNSATLVFSFIGMASKEVAVGNQRKFDISLTTNIIGVNEVVVTALGISREKKSLAYSVSEVKGPELARGAGSNLIKSLDGRVSGVNFTQSSSDPSGSVFVTIRGATSLNLSGSTMAAQPLFVVDGIPLGTTAGASGLRRALPARCRTSSTPSTSPSAQSIRSFIARPTPSRTALSARSRLSLWTAKASLCRSLIRMIRNKGRSSTRSSHATATRPSSRWSSFSGNRS